MHRFIVPFTMPELHCVSIWWEVGGHIPEVHQNKVAVSPPEGDYSGWEIWNFPIIVISVPDEPDPWSH